MGQVNTKGQVEYTELYWDSPTKVHIPATNRYVTLRGMKPGTIEKLTRLWLERDVAITENSADTLKSMCKEPFFAIKEAVIMTINNFWGLRFIYPIKWRIWAYLYEYTEIQMAPIIQEGKKKLPLMAHWNNMAYSTDMRMDWKKMTKKEAEQYRAELLLGAKAVLLKNTQSSEGTGSE